MSRPVPSDHSWVDTVVLRQCPTSPVAEGSSEYLVGPAGERIDGFALDGDLRQSDDATGGAFAILGVPIGSPGEVWRLVLVHTDGRVDDVFSVRFTPVAGGVLVLEP